MKRLIFLSILLILALLSADAQKKMVKTRAYQDYFDQYSSLAVEEMHRHHIPASITLAQAVLESAAGRSELAVKGKNHFGIKCKGWTGRKTYHDDDERGECFRAYNTVLESFEDHSLFLVNSKRYSQLFQLKTTDYKGWAKGLKACGYATSPTYAEKLIEIVELYQLDRYDRAHSGSSVSDISYPPVQPAAPVNAHRVYAANNNYYVLARRGDTYRSIAEELNTKGKKLAKYNERDIDDLLEEGEPVWLMKKARRASKEYKGVIHTVRPNESMYSISQKYGIRLKNLYKMNRLSASYQLRVGDQLRIR